ncbi:MAG: DUF177 domain-containing protein [Oscillospiraceae bacterium]
MEVNLLPILNCDGRKMKLVCDVEFENVKDDIFEVLQPIHVDGEIVNMSDNLELTAKVHAKVKLCCDRCMEDFETEMDFEFSERLKKEYVSDNSQDENPDIIHFTGSSFDLSEMVYENLVVNIPTKVLCNEDCLGMCPKCGKNLNFGVCDCESDITDPRFDALDKLNL